MLLNKKTFWIAAVLPACLFALIAVPVVHAEDATPAKKEAAHDKAKADPFALPEGGPEVLAKFIKDIQKNIPKASRKRPKTKEEKEAAKKHREYCVKATIAADKAAEKILRTDKDPASKASQIAFAFVMRHRPQDFYNADKKRQVELLDEAIACIGAKKKIAHNEIRFCLTICQSLERMGSKKLAVKAYKEFGEIFTKTGNANNVAFGKYCTSASRRLNLLGSQLTLLTGKTLDGKEFDWKAFSKDKVVLIDFWATWCGPCVGEMPNIKKMHKLYHARGFEVVGISLDKNVGAVKRFVKQKNIPWTMLFDPAHKGWGNPMAKHYGVHGIPTLILVDRKGKVVSTRARGPELAKQLKKLIGPPNAKKK